MLYSRNSHRLFTDIKDLICYVFKLPSVCGTAIDVKSFVKVAVDNTIAPPHTSPVLTASSLYNVPDRDI